MLSWSKRWRSEVKLLSGPSICWKAGSLNIWGQVDFLGLRQFNFSSLAKLELYLGSAKRHGERFFEMFSDFFVGGVDLVLGQGFTGGAVGEREGEGAFVGCDFGAGGVGELVETGHGNEERLLVFGEGLFDFEVGQGGGDFHRDVATGGRELREGLDLETVRMEVEDFFKIEFGKVDGM